MIKFSSSSFELKCLLAGQIANAKKNCLFPVDEGWRVVFPFPAKSAPFFWVESLFVSNPQSLLAFIPAVSLGGLEKNDRHVLDNLRSVFKQRKADHVEPVFFTDEASSEKARGTPGGFSPPSLLCFGENKARFLVGSFRDEKLNSRLKTVRFNGRPERASLPLPMIRPRENRERMEILERFLTTLPSLANEAEARPVPMKEACEKALPFWSLLDGNRQTQLEKSLSALLEEVFREFDGLRDYFLFEPSEMRLRPNLSLASPEGRFAFFEYCSRILERALRYDFPINLEWQND